MLNYIWGGMILLGLLVAALNGRLNAVTLASIDSAKEAVTVCITTLGIMSMWCGLMRIGEASGLIKSMTNSLMPLLKFLYPQIPKNHRAYENIATNTIANILGLGWAATPAGLKAMSDLQELNPDKKTASKTMCTFMILNMSSLQLITISVIAYRSQYNSPNPTSIIGPSLAATAVTTLVGVITAKLFERLTT